MSRACFVDTFALLAMLNPSDSRHREAMARPGLVSNRLHFDCRNE